MQDNRRHPFEAQRTGIVTIIRADGKRAVSKRHLQCLTHKRRRTSVLARKHFASDPAT